MKYPHTGLYHYCYHLGLALQKNYDPEKLEFYYYIKKNTFGIFGEKANYIAQHSLQKFILPSTKQFDIWHTNYQGTQYFPKKRQLKIVLTIHDLNFLHENKKTEEKKKEEIEKIQKKIERADHIVAISEFVLNDIKNHFRLNGQPTSVIYNGCNININDEISMPSDLPKGKYLYTIGTITDKKNFHVLPSLLVDNDLFLVISGIILNKEYYEKIIKEAKYHKVEKRVIFTGAVNESEKKWYMQNCEAFVFPSIAEGFGLPVIEAMFFGKPVILSTHTSLPEIGGNDAYYFNSFDPEVMRSSLYECISSFDNNRAGRLRERAISFKWENAASSYLNIYENL
jgi:glycosyltransferase involved in cell wall biosynthesis